RAEGPARRAAEEVERLPAATGLLGLAGRAVAGRHSRGAAAATPAGRARWPGIRSTSSAHRLRKLASGGRSASGVGPARARAVRGRKGVRLPEGEPPAGAGHAAHGRLGGRGETTAALAAGVVGDHAALAEQAPPGLVGPGPE